MQDADTSAAADSGTSFDAAFSSQPAPAPAPEPAGGDGDDGHQPRDEHGRFAAKAQAEADAAAEAGDEPAPKPEPERDHRIPIRELLDERDRRQAAERRAAEYERQVQAWQRQQREAEQAPQRPDPIQDPDAYADWVQQSIGGEVKTAQQLVREQFVDLTFELAIDKHGQEAVDAAMKALEEARDPRAAAEVNAAKNPAKALMAWHKRHQAMTEVGDDLDGYKAKLKATLKSDPEFRKEFMAELEAEARGGNPASRSDTVTALPSLNRAPGSAGGQRPGSLGETGEERFENAFGRRKRA